MSLRYSYLPVRKNFSSRGGKAIRYIVIHDTGNDGKGATARAHRTYVGTNTRGASAHYFVDDHEICQFVGDSKAAWAVGDGRGRYGITNQNSLSIEICINRDGDYDKAVANARELVKNLQERFGIDNAHVVRHYDASRKSCPGSMMRNNWARWHAFKKSLEEPMRLRIDTTKDSVAVPVEKKEAPMEKTDTTYTHKNGLHILKVPAEKIYLALLGGKTLRQVGAYGINGTFFDMAHPDRPEGCWGIAINGGKPLGPNATRNHHDGTKRATLIYGEGRLTVERIFDIAEVERPITWAVGGVGLLPSFDPRLEKVPTSISYTTRRSAIGFLGRTVYLVATDDAMSLPTLRDKMKALGLEGAIALDGGGSTQMLWKDNQGIHSARRLNNMIGVKA